MISTKAKTGLLALMLLLYIIAAIAFNSLADSGIVTRPAEIQENSTQEEVARIPDVAVNLEAAKLFFNHNLLTENGHINLYKAMDGAPEEFNDDSTNSEAISYFLLWNAIDKNKDAFDHSLDFLESRMLHQFGFLMWKLNGDDIPANDGQNDASDADLRAINALVIAERQWGDKRYTRLINTIAAGLEKVAITDDKMLAPSGGASGENSSWTSNEVWLSYSDFTTFAELEKRRGEPWGKVYENMKEASLGGQIYNGLYNSQLTTKRKYGNGIDSGAYSINSLWMMVRNAESGDKELQYSARKSLGFYKQKFATDGKLFESYLSSGQEVKKAESPWVYALVARAAISLHDWDFSSKMKDKLLEMQTINTTSQANGAFAEGGITDMRVGQFTMQEAILTLQQYALNMNSYEIYLALNRTGERNETRPGGG